MLHQYPGQAGSNRGAVAPSASAFQHRRGERFVVKLVRLVCHRYGATGNRDHEPFIFLALFMCFVSLVQPA